MIIAGMRRIELNWLVLKQPIRSLSGNLGWDPASRAEPYLRPLDLMREDRDRNLPPHQLDLNTDSAVGSKLFNHAWRPAADQMVDEANLLAALEVMHDLNRSRCIQTDFDPSDDPDVFVADPQRAA